jgi:predicted NUDIX family NTP pyrophosphohydrolase
MYLTVPMEWPPGSGRPMEFTEIDRAEFISVRVAKRKVNAAQASLIDELDRVLAERG